MERKKKHGIIRRGIAIILSIVLTMVGIDFGQVVSVKAETDYTTLYFIDDTKEQWISNKRPLYEQRQCFLWSIDAGYAGSSPHA